MTDYVLCEYLKKYAKPVSNKYINEGMEDKNDGWNRKMPRIVAVFELGNEEMQQIVMGAEVKGVH